MNVSVFRNWEFSGITKEERATLVKVMLKASGRASTPEIRSSGNRLMEGLYGGNDWFVIPEGSSRHNFFLEAKDLLEKSEIGRAILAQLEAK